MSMEFQGKGELGLGNRRSVLFANNNLTYIQLAELQKDINELVFQNKKKYLKIMECRGDFEYQLYKMGEFQANSKAYGKQMMMRHIFRLLEEKNYLDRQLFLIGFKEEEEAKEQERVVSNETNHFQLLKNIWKKEGGRRGMGAAQHIQQLNAKVGQIKNNIQSLIRIQSNEKRDFEDTYLGTVRALNERSRECRRCADLTARDQYLSRKMEAIEEKMSVLSEENIAYLEEINARDEKIKRMSKLNLRQEAELKDRVIRLEQEVLKRDQTIRGLKKVVTEFQRNRFVNQSEGFQLFLKGVSLDLSKFDKKISISCEKLMAVLSQDVQNEMKVFHQTLTRSVARSKADSTEDSNKSSKQHTNQQCQIPIYGKDINPESVFVRIERTGGHILEKKVTGQVIELKQKIEDSELGAKRYVRTSSKRDIRSNSILKEDEIATIKSRGASPTFVLQME